MPDRTAARIIGQIGSGLRQSCGLRGEVFAAERFHVTLHGGALPGAPMGETIERMCAAGESIAAGSFALGFDHAMSFPRNEEKSPFVLRPCERMSGAHDLSDALRYAMTRQGLLFDRSFEPHLTLLYDAALVPPVDARFVRWTVRDFVLIRSLRGGTHYQFLGRWPLRPIPLR